MSSPALAATRPRVADYVELTKPRITFMVMLTALVGFVMASPAGVDGTRLLLALIGTGLVAGGASALNMVIERDVDARMRRTSGRPIPSGRLRPGDALAFGMAVSGAGLAVLALWASPLSAVIAALTWGAYVLLYTPLKPRTSLSTIVGALPGALPPVIGWAAARGQLEGGAFLLFAILFLWQIPHFLAIAWIYREDYARGGLPMLPVLDRDGRLTGRQAVANALALLVISTGPALSGMAGRVYLVGALALGACFVGAALWAATARTIPAARGLFLTSVIYLAGLSALLLLDRA